MADMADLDSVEAAWADLGEIIDTNDLTAGDLHQLVGRPQGLLRPARRHRLHQLQRAGPCSNGRSPSRRRVLFFPDQHLGRNTARTMGIPLDQMTVWDPREPLGGNAPQPSNAAGSCSGKAIARSIRCSTRRMSTSSGTDFRAARSWFTPNA